MSLTIWLIKGASPSKSSEAQKYFKQRPCNVVVYTLEMAYHNSMTAVHKRIWKGKHTDALFQAAPTGPIMSPSKHEILGFFLVRLE